MLSESEQPIINAVKDVNVVKSALDYAQQIAAYNCQYMGARGAMDSIGVETMKNDALKEGKIRMQETSWNVKKELSLNRICGTCDNCL